MQQTEYAETAQRILSANDRGGFTVPTARLYPFQWNWDSVFVALGFAEFDRDRAWQELETLVSAQWSDGMIPQIVFRAPDADYFPGPETWQSDLGPLSSSGISNPPVLASIMLEIVSSGDDSDLARAEALFDSTLRWHRWFHTARMPEGMTTVCTVHPWETGRDNNPDWDIGLEEMDVHKSLPSYERQDTKHADPAERPSDADYDRYVSIICAGIDVGWDQQRLMEEGPFLMADPGMHFILMRAHRNLLDLATRLSEPDSVKNDIEEMIQQCQAGCDFLWNEEVQAFCARDVRTRRFSNGFSSASALAPYARVANASRVERTIERIDSIAEHTSRLFPSWAPGQEGFEPTLYWRGPLWPQMNYLIQKGLREQGNVKLADKVAIDLLACIEKSGFRECFNPNTGDGLIGDNFSWTSAMYLVLTSQLEREARPGL